MNHPPRVAGIILAAGAATRMGRTKQLLPFRGKSILECVVDSALASSLHQVIVVLGHETERIIPLLEGRNVTTVINTDHAAGQSGSLKAGLLGVAPEAEAVLFLLGDQPLVTPEIIDAIVATYQGSPAPVVMPVHEGRRGNPVLFSRETFPRIEALSGDCGARAIFGEYAERSLTVPLSDPAILFDIDTEDDYEALLRRETSPSSGAESFRRSTPC